MFPLPPPEKSRTKQLFNNHNIDKIYLWKNEAALYWVKLLAHLEQYFFMGNNSMSSQEKAFLRIGTWEPLVGARNWNWDFLHTAYVI